jgi:hypothetical protein
LIPSSSEHTHSIPNNFTKQKLNDNKFTMDSEQASNATDVKSRKIAVPTGTRKKSAAPAAPAPTFTMPFTFGAGVAVTARDPMQYDILLAKFQVAETEIARLQLSIKEWENAATNVTSENATLQADKTELRNTTNTNMAEIIRLNKVIEGLQKQLKTAGDTIKNRDDDIEYLNKQCTGLLGEVEAEKKKLTDGKEQAEKIKAEAILREEHITAIEDQLHTSNERNDELEKIQKYHEDEIKREKIATAEMKRAKEAVENQFSTYIEDKKNETSQKLIAELTTKKEEVITKETEIASLKSEAVKAAASRDEEIQGLREEINQLKADAKLRVNTHPEVFKSTKVPKKNKVRDLQKELDADSEDDTANNTADTTSSSSSSDSDGEKKDAAPKIIYVDRIKEVEVIKEVPKIVEVVVEKRVVEIVRVPGPTQLRDRSVTVEHIIKNQSRLEAWFGAERDFIVLLVQFLVASIAYLLGIKLASSLRSETAFDNVPLDDDSDKDTFEDAANQINMQTGVSVGSKAAADGPAPGTDPADPKPDGNGTKSSKDSVDLKNLIPPIDEKPDTRVPLDGENKARKSSNAKSNGSSNAGDDAEGSGNGGAAPSQEGFFDILGARRPPIRGTLFTMLLHLVVYYFVYVCIMTYFERKMWISANDPARITTLELVRAGRDSLWYSLFGVGGAARFDSLVLAVVKLFGISLKPFPSAG